VEVNGYTIEPGAYLRGADFAGANLAGANLAGANLTSVRADGLSIWPEGFGPTAAGVIFY
jgi:uncharacterized protein YjbI with pentapeptide repeats